MFRTVEQAATQAQYYVEEQGYTIISESNDVGFYLLAKVTDNEFIGLLQITKNQEHPTHILMDKNDLIKISEMVKGDT